MNAWQALRALRAILRAAVWPDGTGEVVFSSRVHATAGTPDGVVPGTGYPFCLLAPGSSDADEDQADLEISTIRVLLVVRGAGDAYGESALLGGPRSGGVGSSKGRGLLEVEEVLRNAIEHLNGPDGINLRVTSRSAPQAQIVGSDYIVSREYSLEAALTTDRTYAPPVRFLATALGGGQVSLAWALPPARYDRVGVVLRRAAGATPPASASAGTGVSLSSATATSKTDTPGAGQFSYALFGAYDEINQTPTTPDRYSASATLTVTAT